MEGNAAPCSKYSVLTLAVDFCQRFWRVYGGGSGAGALEHHPARIQHNALRHQKASWRQVHRPATCRAGIGQCSKQGARVIGHAVPYRPKIHNVGYHRRVWKTSFLAAVAARTPIQKPVAVPVLARLSPDQRTGGSIEFTCKGVE